MADLTVIQGGGQIRNDARICVVCGIPHHDRCRLLAGHLRHLELLGRSPITVDHRKRAVVTLGRALVRLRRARHRCAMHRAPTITLPRGRCA